MTDVARSQEPACQTTDSQARDHRRAELRAQSGHRAGVEYELPPSGSWDVFRFRSPVDGNIVKGFRSRRVFTTEKIPVSASLIYPSRDVPATSEVISNDPT